MSQQILRLCFFKSKTFVIIAMSLIYLNILLSIIIWSIFPGTTKEIKTEDGESGTLAVSIIAGVLMIIATLLISLMVCVDGHACMDLICKKIIFVFTLLELIPTLSLTIISAIIFTDEQGIDTSLPQVTFSIIAATFQSVIVFFSFVLLIVIGCCLGNSFFCKTGKKRVLTNNERQNLQSKVQQLQQQVQQLQGESGLRQGFHYGIPVNQVPGQQNLNYVQNPQIVPNQGVLMQPQMYAPNPQIVPNQGAQMQPQYQQTPYIAPPVVLMNNEQSVQKQEKIEEVITLKKDSQQ